jgi:N-acetylglucosaminyldiphosphoundecaprenol N-acetyl-beta-D-mannosaminyltransferase
MKSVDQIPSTRILGHRVHMVELPDVVSQMARWIEFESDRCHVVVNTGMHGIMEGHKNPEFKAQLNSADMFAPDGILVVLVARLKGFSISKSKTGPALMWDYFESAKDRTSKHYFYGDTEETLEALKANLHADYPNAEIVGLQSPPFRQLTAAEDEADIRAINEAKPDILWISLGAPKQERWMFDHKHRLTVPVVVGTGASFKFFAEKVRRAPPWLRNIGLEWAWRLIQEPRRVFRRVFVDAPQFVGLVFLELVGLKNYG